MGFSGALQPLWLCDFGPGYYLMFGPNVGPLQYYSHLPIIALSLLLAAYVFFQNRNSLPNQILFFTIVPFAAWVFFDSVIWATNRSDVIMFMWSLQVMIEPLVYIGCLYLLYVLTTKRDAPLNAKLLVAALYVPLILSTPTALNLSGFDLTQCLAEEGPVARYYTYALEIFFLIWILALSAQRIWQTRDRSERKEIAVLLGGVLLLLAGFSWGNIIGSFTGDWQLAQYGLFGMPLFIAILMYSIVRFKTFNAQMIGSIALVFGLSVLSFSLLFVQSVSVFRGVAAATFIFVIIFSVFLIRIILRDIRARQRIEELAHDLEAANRQQESLIHFISHEVKGSLGKCSGTLSMILEGDYGTAAPAMVPVIDRALGDTRQAAEMITAILMSANIKTGKLHFDMQPFPMKEIVSDIVTSLTDHAKTKGLSLEFNATSDGRVVGDKNMLAKHVIRNLIENAVQYTPSGSIRVELSETADTVRMSVSDTGVGLSDEDKQVLFTEGGRGKDSMKVNVNSTGFGLFFSKQLIEAHKGSITAYSEGRGKGSTFTVILPRATI
ncbi:MAG: HAMP domain-containing histidine kinase [Parcubacteria group bacterium]|nr:HAMP domain-containing histidine kinase [Parcubacteria group bacterium]